jgi:hypothetical protein
VQFRILQTPPWQSVQRGPHFFVSQFSSFRHVVIVGVKARYSLFQLALIMHTCA